MLKRLQELPRYELGENTPDIRGWDAYSRNGDLIGRVDDMFVDTNRDKNNQMLVKYVAIAYDNTDRLIPTSLVDIDTTAHRVNLDEVTRDNIRGYSEYRGGEVTEPPEATHTAGFTQAEEAAPPNAEREILVRLMEEHLVVSKQEQKQSEAVIRKTLETHTEAGELDLRQEHIQIEHHLINKPLKDTDFKDEQPFAPMAEIHIPLYTEEAVVNKEPFVKEEVVIRKDVEYRTEKIQGDVRSENLEFVGTEPEQARNEVANPTVEK